MRKSTIEKMEEHINKVTELPIEIKKKYRKQIFCNLLICIVFTIYITAIIIGKRVLNDIIFFKCLKILTINMLAITIIIFEDAYRKDNLTLGLFGIETLVITLITLFSESIFKSNSNIWTNLLIAYIALYYIIKSFVIYIKEKKKYFMENNDIPEIIKKESKDKLKPIMEKINEENINKEKKNSKKKETTTKKDKTKTSKKKTKQEKKM